MFATLGNHDYNAPERVVDAFREGPIRLLRNETVDIGGVLLAGLDDAIARRHRPDELPNADRSESLLVALHEPDFVSDLPSHVGLMLSGHSHGGQVRLPLMGAIHTPYGARRYIEGVYQPAEVPLFVSRGIGTVGPDLRLYCPPEVAILTLSGPA
jgi:predicted MPP superfamily phosphohydrolase